MKVYVGLVKLPDFSGLLNLYYEEIKKGQIALSRSIFSLAIKLECHPLFFADAFAL